MNSAKKSLVFGLLCAACVVLSSCGGGVGDILDVLDKVPRKTIDTTKLGVNAFCNDSRFGSISSQLAEVKNTLRLNSVRVLFAWNDQVQPSPTAALNFSFYDDIARALPAGSDALVLITGVPSWMHNPANWLNGNPRKTFVERWLKPVVSRYRSNSRIIGWEIWNEPNYSTNPENITMGFIDGPENFAELLAMAQNAAKDLAPGKLVVSGATTAINQNYPETLNYNRRMRDAGVKDMVDVWGVHYYGRQFENVVRGGGVADFLNGLSKVIWVTESGAQGVNAQLPYGEQVFPFLIDKIPGVERIYYYQFTEASPYDVTYGLRNLDPAFPVSDLYVWLRDR